MSLIRTGFLALVVVLPLTGGFCRAAPDNDARMSPLVRAVQLCRKSVVNIHTEKNSDEDRDSRFFASKSRRVTGMGTGIVVDERGYIVTNYHVVHEVEQITVTLHDGETYDGRAVSFDRSHDLAVIHIDAKHPLTVMPMGTSCDLMLAEQVFAVGNAFGYEHTVTAGIISALSRDVEVDETQSYKNLIQTDASINPGNSGGPLLNMNGEVIGINVAIRAGAQRIGFAIPIDDARVTIARLLSPERLNGVIHGVITSDVKTPESRKLVVEQVISGSAAEKCGLKPGDVIRSARDVDVQDSADWERALLDMPAGKVLDVAVLRDGTEVKLPFTVGVGTTVPVAAMAATSTPARTVAASETTSAPARATDPILESTWKLFGIRLQELSEREQRSLDSRYKGGMKIVYVKSGGLASVHGIKSGDILLGLDGYETLGVRNLSFILQEARLRKMDTLSFQILRSGAGALIGRMNLRSAQ
ncbi:MAG: trypsin-like peptidase domain-containing protein [Planctomycetaceae bacterium]